MDVVRLGPLMIPVYVVCALLGLGAAHLAAAWFRHARNIDAGPALWKVVLAGWIAGRLVFVLRHGDLYRAAPLSVLDVRDAGFDLPAGLLTAVVVAAELARRTDALRRPLAAAVLSGCFVWLASGALNDALTPTGAPLPAMAVRRLDGTAVPLASFAGRPLVVNLWASWCGPCRREMPALRAAQIAHPDVAFVFVNQGESAELVRQFLDANRLDMANVVTDPAGRLGALTGTPAYPSTLFYGPDGRLRMRHVGELSQATIRDKVAELKGRR